jgi:hypothetical protein
VIIADPAVSLQYVVELHETREDIGQLVNLFRLSFLPLARRQEEGMVAHIGIVTNLRYSKYDSTRCARLRPNLTWLAESFLW